MSVSTPALEGTAELDDALARLNIEGHWKSNREGPPSSPAFTGEPYVWRWLDVYPLVLQAGEVLGIEGGASRRTLRLCSPGLPNKTTTSTIHTSIQMVKPGEIAQAHRHSIGAFRFVIKGSGAHTTVDGERFIMEKHDLVLTPAWSWHNHGNESGEPIIWIDGHDMPLLRSLNLMFFEAYNDTQQTISRPEGFTRRLGGAMRAKNVEMQGKNGIPYIYKGREAMECLRSISPSERDPYDGLTIDYVNPFTGGPTMPTMACRLHLLESKTPTGRHRHTASTIYHVVEGTGTTVINDKTIEWRAGDMFVVPNWAWHSHAATSAAHAVLFSVTDEPILTALGHMRSEADTSR